MRPSANQSRSGAFRQLSRGLRAQKGAAAIEAALLFVIFFTLFYAIVSYSLPLMMMQAFQNLASGGARAAVAVDPNADNYQVNVENYVRSFVVDKLDKMSLPQAAHDTVITELNKPESVQFVYDQESGKPTAVIVTVKFPNYTSNPLIPIMRLPGIGEVPKLPADLIGQAVVQL